MGLNTIQPIMTAVQQAAILCQRVQDDYMTRLNKAGNEPVTIADYGSQAIISRAIHRAFPDEAIIAEESASQFQKNVSETQQQTIAALVGEILGETIFPEDIIAWLNYGQDVVSTNTWIIDPIDGTRGFINDRNYVIGVGLVEAGRAMGAVMGCPTWGQGELLVAWDGIAYRQPLDGSAPPERFTVSQRAFGEIVHPVVELTTGRASRPVIKQIERTFTIGEPALDKVDAQLELYAQIAVGAGDFFVAHPMTRVSPKVWDHAAGVALVEAAGGRVTDFDDQPLDFSSGKRVPNKSLIISNGRVHPYVVDTVKARPKFI